MSTLLLATRNAGKLAELQRLLETAVPGVEVVGLRDVDGVPGGARDRGDVRRERAAEGARGGPVHRAAGASPTTPG